MKKLIFALSLFIIPVSFLSAQTADDIIAKYIAALGGKTKLDAMKSIYLEGDANIQGQKFPVKIWVVNKKACRIEFTINGMTGFSIIRTDSGWNYQPFSGQKDPQPMTKDEVKSLQPALETEEPLMTYKEHGYKVTYEGKDDVDGTDAYKIKVVISDSLSETYYIDMSSYYVLRKKTKTNTNGKESESTEDDGDYKKTDDGYVFAMTQTGGFLGDTKFTAVKVNSTIDPKLFKPLK